MSEEWVRRKRCPFCGWKFSSRRAISWLRCYECGAIFRGWVPAWCLVMLEDVG